MTSLSPFMETNPFDDCVDCGCRKRLTFVTWAWRRRKKAGFGGAVVDKRLTVTIERVK